MKLANVDFPKPLLDALRDNNLVVFAGAGVSMGKPACLPNFCSLTKVIAERSNKVRDEKENLEQFLGRLHDDGVEIYDIAKKVLSPEGLKPTSLHQDLLRLYHKDGPVHLVTTNFDILFEEAAGGLFNDTPPVFCAPALPLGRKFNGIVHVHGSIANADEMILTDTDFGRAYLNEGWARRFLVELYNNFTILFVGYSHSDTVMNYLVRALPPQREGLQRYALVRKSIADHRRWKHLKIETIPYPQYDENDHSELDKAISKLADYVRRGMVGWQREISAIADKPPQELNEEDEGIIAHALEDETKTEFFTKSASHPDWIEWLDKRGRLTPLFGTGQLQHSDRNLSWWLVNRYLENHPKLMFLLISRHRTRLHPTFWEHIARKIGSSDETLSDTAMLSQWIALLLSTAPEDGETPDGSYVFTSNLLAMIAQRCIPYKMIEEVLLIFDAMIRSRLLIEENHYLPRGETEEDLEIREAFQISLDVPLVGEYDELNKVWEERLRPNLPKIAQRLLERVIRCLENQYFFHRTLGRATRLLERASTLRSAIESHDQNVRGHDTDVVIDVARECLDWLATHEPNVAAQWCNRLAKSDSPLQRRLAVHSLSKRKDLTPDKKIQWLLENIDLHEYSIHHEVYQAVRHAYPRASVDCRMALIERVQSYQFPHAEHPDNRELTAKEQFDWFHWLHIAKLDCSFAKQAMDEVLMEYPNFTTRGLREYPEFTSYIQSGHVDIPSPLTLEDLPATPTADSITQFSPREGATLREEIENLKERIKQDFDEGLNVANTLAEAGQWDGYQWRVLINTWTEMELDLNKHRQVLKWFAKTELYSKYSYEIADWLYALVKDGGLSYAFGLLPEANAIAVALWQNLDRTVSIDAKQGWHNQSVQYPVWGLTHFWLASASLWRQQQDPKPPTLSEDYRRFLLEIIRDSSPIGGLGKSILASRLAFLLAVDEEWTREHLLPLFDLDNADFQAAWDGFVTEGRISPPAAEALEQLFLKAVTRISTQLYNQRYEFVECYIVMLIYVVDEVLSKWIPQLFEHDQPLPVNSERTLLRGDDHTIPEIIALKLTKCLKHMDDSEKQELWQRWLKDYWQDRLNGKPAPLTPDEANLMLDWLPELNTKFPEAVDLAINMPPPSLKHARIFACLVTNETWQNHPEAVAKLLLYLWDCNIPIHRHSAVLTIIVALLELNISSELKQKLEEIKIQL